jgi:hypothetical protein
VSDHVLRPVHGLLEWLVPEDTGQNLSFLTVTATEKTLIKYEREFRVLNVTSRYSCIIFPHKITNTFS